MPEKILADIPFSFVEYQATFRDPIFEVWELRSALLAAVFRALHEWDARLEKVTWKQNPTNAAEVQVMFALPSVEAVFRDSLGGATLFVNNPDWSKSDVIGKIARVGTAAVLGVSKGEIGKQHLTLAMHLMPTEGSIHDITSRYVRFEDAGSMAGQVRAYGFSIYRENCAWVVDSSALYVDALFVRISRTFSPTTPFSEVASELSREESDLLNLLQLRLE